MTDTNLDEFVAAVNASAGDPAKLQAATEQYSKAKGNRMPTVAEVILGYSIFLVDSFGQDVAEHITVASAQETRSLMKKADEQQADQA